jgi:sulfatase modifying factor 1
MKSKLNSSKFFRVRSIPIFSLVIFTIFFMQNCSYGSRGKRNRIHTEKLSLPYKGKQWGPRMRYIDGGSISVITGLGSPYRSDISKPGDITVTSFFIAECPTTNRQYFIYLDDLKRSGKIKEYKAALPDVNVWKKEFTANDNLRNYPYAKVFLDYPTVGVTYEQAEKYCIWLTEKETSLRSSKKRVNEKVNPIPSSESKMLQENVKEGLVSDSIQKPETELPQEKEKEGTVTQNPKSEAELTQEKRAVVSHDIKPESELDNKEKNKTENDESTEDELDSLSLEELEEQYVDSVERATGEARYVYRIPTEAELIFAAKATQTTQAISRNEEGYEEVVETTRVGDYGNGESNVRIVSGKPENIGKFVGLFKINRGNYKGIPGENDTNAPTENVYTRDPNGLGLRGMYGNVYIWTSDFYRQDPASVTYSDYNPARSDDLYDNEYAQNSPLNEPCMVIFGGSFDGTPEDIRSFMNAKSSANNVGFRIVASVA